MRRCQFFNVGGINTTEICTLKCKMCMFHGKPFAHKQSNMHNRTLPKEYVEKFLYELPRGNNQINFASMGEFFVDKNALHYLRLAKKLGFRPTVTSNFTLVDEDLIDDILQAGVEVIIASTDACSKEIYKEIRLNENNFEHILKMLAYLKSKKSDYPNLQVQSNNILMGYNTESEFIEFWKDKVDVVNVSALMTSPFSYDQFLDGFDEKKCAEIDRSDCVISVFLTPSGVISPCCSISAVLADKELDWLPHVKNVTPVEAYNKLLDLYYDKNSPMHELCGQCSSWVRWHPDGSCFFKGMPTGLNEKLDYSSAIKHKPMDTEIHIHTAESKNVIPILSADNPVSAPLFLYLSEIKISSNNSTNIWNYDYFSKEASFYDGFNKLLLPRGMVLSIPRIRYEYIWNGQAFELPKGASSIICNVASFEGAVAFGLLDTNSGQWFLPPQSLQKYDDAQSLVNLLK